MLKFAVIGVGNMGKHHARIYAEHGDVDLVAICDTNRDTADSFAEKFKCKAYYDVNELLSKEKLNGVSICVPTTLHKNIVDKVASAKVNILLEKPVAQNLSDANEIKKIISANKVKCVVGHIERYNPATRKAIQMILSGEIGKIFYINVLRQGPYPPGVVDVDVLTDLGIHDLEIVNYILTEMSEPIEDFCLETQNFINKKEPDIARILMRTKNNIIINQITDILSPTKIRKLFVCGSKGLLELDYIAQELIFYENGKHKEFEKYTDILMGVTVGAERTIHIEKKEPLSIEIENFVEVVQGKSKPFVSLDDAIASIALLDKIKTKFK